MELNQISLVKIQQRKTLLKRKLELGQRLHDLQKGKQQNRFDDPQYSEQVSNDYNNYQLLLQKKQLLDEQLKSVKDDFQKKTDVKTLLEKQQTLMKDILNKVTLKFIQSIDKRLTEVFQYTFNDTQKTIRLEMEERYGKVVLRLVSELEMPDKTVYQELVEENEAHSVQVVLGLVFLVFFIVQLNLPRVVFLDETLSGLDSDTLERFIPFMQAFCKDMGFSFCCISHDPRLLPYADKVYVVDDGNYKEMK